MLLGLILFVHIIKGTQWGKNNDTTADKTTDQIPNVWWEIPRGRPAKISKNKKAQLEMLNLEQQI